MNIHVKTWLGTTIIIIIAVTAGIFVWEYYNLSPIPNGVPQVTNNLKPKVKENNVGIANPVSVFCGDNDGILEIRTAEDGGQIGYCKFSDGTECEEWAFMREECKQGDSLNQLDTSDWQTYRNEEYGFEFKYPKDWYVVDSNNLNLNLNFSNYNAECSKGDKCEDYLMGFSLDICEKNETCDCGYFMDNFSNPNKEYFLNLENNKRIKIKLYTIKKEDTDGHLPRIFACTENHKYAYKFSNYSELSPKQQIEEVEYLEKSLETFKFTN